MRCCSPKTLAILLAITGIGGLLVATGKVNAAVFLPFLPFLLCPLMCGLMMLSGKRSEKVCCDMNVSMKTNPSIKHH
jgi:hypothetical protein